MYADVAENSCTLRVSALSHARGFTLVELMVVLAIMAVLGTVAMVGIRQDQMANGGKAFVKDIEGAATQSRNLAIDGQSEVTLRVGRQAVEIHQFNNTTKATDALFRYSAADAFGFSGTTADAAVSGYVCVLGVVAGIRTPRQAASFTPPSTCLGASDEFDIVFDGTGNVSLPWDVDASGASIWIRDSTEGGGAGRINIIQIFPGGLIRSFVDV